MGAVDMAEQEHPVRRRVALKVIKPGMDSKQVVARFEAERQAVAMMGHLHIAKVLDAGTTDAGRPYFWVRHHNVLQARYHRSLGLAQVRVREAARSDGATVRREANPGTKMGLSICSLSWSLRRQFIAAAVRLSIS
jgi:hypothetical protein